MKKRTSEAGSVGVKGKGSSVRTSSTEKSASANSTADRTLEILLSFDEQHPVWTPTTMAMRFGIPRSTIYRYFNSLRAHGLIVDDGKGGVQLSARVVALARAATGTATVIRIAAPYLDRLSEEFGEFIALRERIGDELVPLDRRECWHHVRIPYLRNQTAPWPATAGAKVMMAFISDDERSELMKNYEPVQFTSKTITDPNLFDRELDRIRKQGFATTDEERDEGVCGLAAPIFVSGKFRYCISIGGPAFRFVGNRLAGMTSEIAASAEAITREFDEYQL